MCIRDRPEEHVHEVGLRDRVERAPLVEHEVADVVGLQPAAPLGRGLAHALDHRVDAPQLAREQAQDPIGLAQGPRVEDDGARLLVAHSQLPASRVERRAKTTRGMPARSARSCAGSNAPAAANSARTAAACPAPTSTASTPPGRRRPAAAGISRRCTSVSYTHLTLPTLYSV